MLCQLDDQLQNNEPLDGTSTRLVAELRALPETKAIHTIIVRALSFEYDDMRSPLDLPKHELVCPTWPKKHGKAPD